MRWPYKLQVPKVTLHGSTHLECKLFPVQCYAPYSLFILQRKHRSASGNVCVCANKEACWHAGACVHAAAACPMMLHTRPLTSNALKRSLFSSLAMCVARLCERQHVRTSAGCRDLTGNVAVHPYQLLVMLCHRHEAFRLHHRYSMKYVSPPVNSSEQMPASLPLHQPHQVLPFC